MAFDAGLFTFRDVLFKPKKSNDDSTTPIFTLITNPKNLLAKTRYEPFGRVKLSSHIRFLVFAEYEVTSAHVSLDGVFIGNARRVADKSVPLYTLQWKPEMFENGIHVIEVVVEVSEKVDKIYF